RACLPVLEAGRTERTIFSHWKDDEAVRIWRVGGDHSVFPVSRWDPEDRRAVRIQTRVRYGLIESGADQEKLPIRRENGHGGNAISLLFRIDCIGLLARAEFAFAIDGHQPKMVGPE